MTMTIIRGLAIAALFGAPGAAQEAIRFPTEDGGSICVDLYGQGPRGVVLAHGGRFVKESWQDQARVLAGSGFQVLAFDFRGFGCSTGPGQADFDNAPFEKDVLAAVRYLKRLGARTVSAVGGSFGAAAAGDASIKSAAGVIDRIVFLGASPNLSAANLKSDSLFIVARDDSDGVAPRLPGIRAQYEKAPKPKRLIVLEGSAHAQFLFQTEHARQVTREIVDFLKAPGRK